MCTVGVFHAKLHLVEGRSWAEICSGKKKDNRGRIWKDRQMKNKIEERQTCNGRYDSE